MVNRPIPSCPGYLASEDGTIIRNGRRLAATDNGHGYLRVTVSLSGVRGDKYVHRLICEAFYGPPASGEQARHLNGCRSDNRSVNLRWSDRVTNDADKDIHGTRLVGEAVRHSRMTTSIVIEARRRAAAGERYDMIAAALNLPPKTVADAIAGRRWKHVPGAMVACHSRRKFTEGEVRAIRLLKGVEKEGNIAARYGVARNSIWQIMNRKSYRHVQ